MLFHGSHEGRQSTSRCTFVARKRNSCLPPFLRINCVSVPQVQSSNDTPQQSKEIYVNGLLCCFIIDIQSRYLPYAIRPYEYSNKHCPRQPSQMAPYVTGFSVLIELSYSNPIYFQLFTALILSVLSVELFWKW